MQFPCDCNLCCTCRTFSGHAKAGKWVGCRSHLDSVHCANAGSFSSLANAVKRVSLSSRKDNHDEGRSLLSAGRSGPLCDSGWQSGMAPAELTSQHAHKAAPSSKSQPQERLCGGESIMSNAYSSSNGGSLAGPPALSRTSFVKNPGLTNIQTPFSNADTLFDHPWQPQDRPQSCAANRLESIAGKWFSHLPHTPRVYRGVKHIAHIVHAAHLTHNASSQTGRRCHATLERSRIRGHQHDTALYKGGLAENWRTCMKFSAGH